MLGHSVNPKTNSYAFQTVHRGVLGGKVISSPETTSLGRFELDFPADILKEITDQEVKRVLKEAVDKASDGKVTIRKYWTSSDDAVLEVDCGGLHLGDVAMQPALLVSSELPASNILSNP